MMNVGKSFAQFPVTRLKVKSASGYFALKHATAFKHGGLKLLFTNACFTTPMQNIKSSFLSFEADKFGSVLLYGLGR